MADKRETLFMDKKKIFLLFFLLLLVVIVLIYLLLRKRKLTATSLHTDADDPTENQTSNDSKAASQPNPDETQQFTEENTVNTESKAELSQEEERFDNQDSQENESSEISEEAITEVSATMEEEVEENTSQSDNQVTDDLFFWTPNGKSYHSDPNCISLKRSKTILSGSEADAAQAGKTTLCSMCKKESDN